MAAVAGHGGEEAWSSPRKGEVNDNLDDGVPPELALLLIKTGPHVAFLHFGKQRRRLHGGLPCLLQTQTIAGGHESHRDGDGEGAAPFPRGLDIASCVAAAVQSGVAKEVEQGELVRVDSRAVLGLGLLHPRSEPGFHGDLLATGGGDGIQESALEISVTRNFSDIGSWWVPPAAAWGPQLLRAMHARVRVVPLSSLLVTRSTHPCPSLFQFGWREMHAEHFSSFYRSAFLLYCSYEVGKQFWCSG